MYAQDEFERAVSDMRAQFLTVSGQIADELTRLAQHVASSPASVRERVITAAAQIASTQQFLRAEADRLPSDPPERYAIMESVLQAQQGALHQLAIIVKQHAPGWHPNLSNTAAWSQNQPSASSWSQNSLNSLNSLNSAPGPAAEANAPAPPTWYPSPPTAQELVTRDWPQTQGNGYGGDTYAPPAQHVWPTNGSAIVPYGGGYADPSRHAPWPGRPGNALVPSPQISGEMRPARYPPNTGQVLATARRQAELVGHGIGSRNLFLIGLVVCALIFGYLSFPWEIRRRDAIANQEAPPAPPVASVPRSSVVTSVPPPSAPPPPTIIARAEEPPEPPAPPPPAGSGLMLPGGMMTTGSGMAIGSWQGQSPVFGREPAPIEVAAAPTKPRAGPAKAEPEAAPAAEGTPRAGQFVAVLFTHQDEPTTAHVFASLQQQYPNELADRQGESQPINLGKKGVWHRLVALPAGSRQDAGELCAQLSAAGYNKCWVKPY